MARRLTAVPRPLALLAAVTLLSLGLRIALINEPCRSPCRTANDHLLVFDEVYYVNAARVIAGITPPADQKYHDAPLGDDPNAEHPQLVKVLMAGSIEAFGDNPFAWRLPSLLFGTIAILAMFALVRAAGGGDALALTAATLMAADNLLLVHGRIGTLDVPVLALMLCAGIAYLRGRPLVAGVLVGIGTAMKLVGPYVLDRDRAAGTVPRSRPGGAGRPPGGLVRARCGRHVPRTARAARPTRAAVRPGERPRTRPLPVCPSLAHAQLRRQPDEPGRSDGDRVIPVGLARRRQADHLPQHQPGQAGARPLPRAPGRALPRVHQPGDHAAGAAVARLRRVARVGRATRPPGRPSCRSLRSPGSSGRSCRSWC